MPSGSSGATGNRTPLVSVEIRPSLIMIFSFALRTLHFAAGIRLPVIYFMFNFIINLYLVNIIDHLKLLLRHYFSREKHIGTYGVALGG